MELLQRCNILPVDEALRRGKSRTLVGAITNEISGRTARSESVSGLRSGEHIGHVDLQLRYLMMEYLQRQMGVGRV